MKPTSSYQPISIKNPHFAYLVKSAKASKIRWYVRKIKREGEREKEKSVESAIES